MARPRPFQTHYSDGSQGRASSAESAALRAVRAVITRKCKTAQVYNASGTLIFDATSHYSQVSLTIHKRKEFK